MGAAGGGRRGTGSLADMFSAKTAPSVGHEPSEGWRSGADTGFLPGEGVR